MHSSNNISWFAGITLKDRPAVGGKGGSLGELTGAGIAVPPGFVVATGAFESFLCALEKEDPIRSCVEALCDYQLDEITRLSKQLRARIEDAPLPDVLQAEILGAHAELCGDKADRPLAVRSSATTEDAEDASFAGLQDTYLWVMGAHPTLKYVRSCWASLYSVPSIAYRRKHRMPESGVAMAVVVQQMVDARTAGVMFTRSPLTGDRSVVTIEGTWGLGSAVVSGEVTPDRFVIAKITGEISVRDISDKHIQHVPAAGGGINEIKTPENLRRVPCISDSELAELKEIGRRVERHYGRPQDIEWAIDPDGKIFLLQSRPETVWSSKEAKPVAKPEENPLTHVMNIFGGRR
ncbi:MAG TPA: PEP/pyruvate-binding domain-containing protein [Terriglobales bacterium]|nr:PEP/pyruvate-binding domain-containing protein [Terriglobales bacterium]